MPVNISESNFETIIERVLVEQNGYLKRTPQTVRLTFDQVAEQLFAEMIDNYYEFYKKVTDDPQAKQRFFDWLFEQYRRGAQ